MARGGEGISTCDKVAELKVRLLWGIWGLFVCLFCLFLFCLFFQVCFVHIVYLFLFLCFAGFSNVAFEKEVVDKGPYESPETQQVILKGSPEKPLPPTDKQTLPPPNGVRLTVNHTRLWVQGNAFWGMALAHWNVVVGGEDPYWGWSD